MTNIAIRSPARPRPPGRDSARSSSLASPACFRPSCSGHPPYGPSRSAAEVRLSRPPRGRNADRRTVWALSDYWGLQMAMEDWFLTAQERGNPASTLAVWCAGNRAEPLIHGATYFDRLVTEVEALRRGDHLFFTDWRGDPDERLRRRRPDRRRVCSPGGRARRRRQGPDLALAPGQARVQRGGEPAPRRGDRARPAARCCSTCGYASAARTTRSWSCCGTRTRRSATSRSSAASTCATAAATTREHRGDPQAMQMSPQYGDTRRGTTCSCALRGPGRRRAGHGVPGALDRPGAAGLAHPGRLARGTGCAAPTCSAGRCRASRPTRRRAGRTPCRCCAPIPAPRRGYAFAPHGERSIARGYTQGGRAGAAPDLPGGPVPVVDGGRRPVRATPCAANPDLHLVAVVPRLPRRGRPVRRCRPTWSAASRRWTSARAGRPATGARLRRREPSRARRSTCTPRSASSTTCGPASAATTSTGAPGPTTASCPARCSTRPATTGNRATRPGMADGARVFARDLRLRLLREHLDRAADGSEDDGLLDPAAAIEAIAASAQALQDWHDGGRSARARPGRLRPHRPERLGLATRLWAVPAVPADLRPGRPPAAGPAEPHLLTRWSRRGPAA